MASIEVYRIGVCVRRSFKVLEYTLRCEINFTFRIHPALEY